MSYKHLEQIQQVMGVKSTSQFTVGRCTKRIKYNFEDGSGALAKIKRECQEGASCAANLYCMNCQKSRNRLEQLLNAVMLNKFHFNRCKKVIYINPIVKCIIGRVFDGTYGTDASCAEKLGISKSNHSENYQKYIDDGVQMMTQLLSDAEIVAGNYKWDEKNPKVVAFTNE